MELKELVLPREKALRYGIGELSDAELIALLLNTGTRAENVLELSARLLGEKQGLMNFLFDDAIEEDHGIGRAKAFRIHAVMEIVRRLPHLLKTRINNERDFFMAFRYYFLGIQSEHLLVVTLDLSNMVKETKTIAGNQRNELELDSRALFAFLKECEGKRILFAHNHPSGSVESSLMDMLASDKLRRLTEKAGKVFEGSYIFTRDRYKRIKKDKKIVDMLMA